MQGSFFISELGSFFESAHTQEADPAICKEENRVLESYFDQLEHDNVPQSRKQ